MEGTSGLGLKTQLTHLGKSGLPTHSFDSPGDKPVCGFVHCRQHSRDSHQVCTECNSEGPLALQSSGLREC